MLRQAMLIGRWERLKQNCWRLTHSSGQCLTNVYVRYCLPTSLSPGGKKMWCLARLTPQFRARMDELLTLYTESLPAGEEVHCFDETPKQLLGTPGGSRNPKPGKSRRIDYEYQRNGTRKPLRRGRPVGRNPHCVSDTTPHGGGHGAVPLALLHGSTPQRPPYPPHPRQSQHSPGSSSAEGVWRAKGRAVLRPCGVPFHPLPCLMAQPGGT